MHIENPEYQGSSLELELLNALRGVVNRNGIVTRFKIG